MMDWLLLCKWTNNGMQLVFGIRAGADCGTSGVRALLPGVTSTQWRKRRHPVPSLLNDLSPPPSYVSLLRILILRPPSALSFCTADPPPLCIFCRSPPVLLHVLRLPIYQHSPPTLDKRTQRPSPSLCITSSTQAYHLLASAAAKFPLSPVHENVIWARR